jgi:hypothetical protein
MRPTAPPFPAWRIAVGVLTLTLVAVTGVAFCVLWNAGWYVQVPRDLVPDDMACRVRMPGTVREVRILPPGAAGGSETGYATFRRKQNEGFGLTVRAAGPDGREPVAELDAFLAEFLRTVAPSKVRSHAVPGTRYTALQAAVTTQKYGNVVARAVHGGTSLYLLVAYGNAVTPDRPDVAAFFDSFALTDED